jgi:hypothetical protein
MPIISTGYSTNGRRWTRRATTTVTGVGTGTNSEITTYNSTGCHTGSHAIVQNGFPCAACVTTFNKITGNAGSYSMDNGLPQHMAASSFPFYFWLHQGVSSTTKPSTFLTT